MTQRWWERFPERLKYELDALEAAGISYERDEAALAHGLMQLTLHVEVAGDRFPLVVRFPDLYPYFRFEVDAPTLNLEHHQNPFGKNLCLIGRGTHHWHTSDTVASLMEQQLPAVIATGRSSDREEVRGREQLQAEPLSAYCGFPASLVIVPGDCVLPKVHGEGTFTIATEGAQAPPPTRLLRGALAEVRGADASLIASTDAGFLSAYAGQRIAGYWVRAAEPIATLDHPQFLKWILERFPGARKAEANRVEPGWMQVWGVVFPEEVGWRESGDGWIFLNLFECQRSRLVSAAPTAPRQQPNRHAKGKKTKRRRR